MKILMVVAALVAVVSAQNGNGGGTSPVYGPPKEDTPEDVQMEAYEPQLFRHVFVHVAPDEPVDEQARTIKIPGGDKHVNIIFVKTPSQSSSSQTEVILPEADQQKNLVYVLLKKNEAENNIKIRRPKAKLPEKPEVYFIRYKDQEEQSQSAGGYQQGPANGGASNGNGGGHQASNGNGNGHHSGNGNGNGGHHSNGNSQYSEAGRYSPAVAPGVIRNPSEVPSSGYGVPL